MKCEFCGAKIKKSDELCPECGKYSGKQESTADMGKCLKKFNCNDNIPFFVFLLIMSVVALIIGAKEIYGTKIISAKYILLIVSGIFVFLMSAYMCLVYYRSYICVCENCIYGVISQQGKPMPQFFILPYAEIKVVDMSVISHGKGGTACIVTILTKSEKEYKIGNLNKKNSKLLTDMLHHRLDKED